MSLVLFQKKFTGQLLLIMVVSTIASILLQLIINLLMAVLLKDFCTKIERNSKLYAHCSAAMQCVSELIVRMQVLKKSLSAILFMTFTSKCLYIIHSSLNIGFSMTNAIGDFGISLWLILATNIWELFYVAIIVDETMETYKSTASKLR